MSDLRQQIIRSVPEDLKRAIAARVASDETNMNDLLVGILADNYRVRFDPSDRRSAAPIGASSDIVLRLPAALKRKLAVDAAKQEREIREIAIDLIADALGVAAAA